MKKLIKFKKGINTISFPMFADTYMMLMALKKIEIICKKYKFTKKAKIKYVFEIGQDDRRGFSEVIIYK